MRVDSCQEKQLHNQAVQANDGSLHPLAEKACAECEVAQGGPM